MSATEEASGLTKLEQEFRDAIVKRMEELRPAVEEYQRYATRLQQFDGPNGGTIPARSRSGGGRATRSTNAARQGSRLEQFVQFAQEHPGMTIADAATALDVQKNYLYRIRDEAIKRGLVRKDGGQVFPTSDEPSAARIAELEAASKK